MQTSPAPHNSRHSKVHHITTGATVACTFAAFITSFGFIVFMPSLPDMMRSLNQSESMVVSTVGMFLIGQYVGSLVFGWLCRCVPHQLLLLFALCLQIAASLLYAVEYDKPDPWFVFGMRLLSGFAAGSCTVGRAHLWAANRGSRSNQTIVMAVMSCFQALGWATGSLFVELWKEARSGYNVGITTLTEYSAPALFTACLALLAAILVAIFVHQPPKEPESVKPDKLGAQPAVTMTVGLGPGGTEQKQGQGTQQQQGIELRTPLLSNGAPGTAAAGTSSVSPASTAAKSGQV